MSTNPSEATIQTAVLKYLHQQGHFCWRQNNLAVYDPKLGQYRAHTGLKGVSDIMCILPPTGQFVGIEVKTGKGAVSVDQLLFERRCRKVGARYHVVRSVDDVKELGL